MKKHVFTKPLAAKARMTLLALLALSGCSQPTPEKLFLLNAGVTAASNANPTQGPHLAQEGRMSRGAASSSLKIGVIVAVPAYLDRPEIMVRTGSYELAALQNARWGEGLSITAARALADDLQTLLPNQDVFGLPAAQRSFDYRIRVELGKFESDTAGNVEAAGRWVVIDDGTDKERAGAPFQYDGTASPGDPKSIAGALSNLLLKVAADIGTELQKPQLANR